MKNYILLILKGMAMGVANVIPGVSGGTIALVTNIYEELINALKSFDAKALNLLLSWKIKALALHTNIYFLCSIFGGSIISVFTIANLFKYLFEKHPILIWSFFFGLILASIYYIAKQIKNWNNINTIILFFGALSAISISFLNPANENDNLFFVFICGIIGISGMMLPGLSGSFILILLGNYELLLVNSIIELDYVLLTFFFLGSVAGLLGFSHIIAYLLKKHKDKTLSMLTGFIFGSLYIIWPWKKIENSIIINGKEKILSYSWDYPTQIDTNTILAIGLMLLGILIVYLLEKTANTNS